MNLDWQKLCALASAEVGKTLLALPEPLRVRVEKLPVTLERQPNADLQAEGIERDTLGLFTGPEFADEENASLPSQMLRCRRRLFCFWKTSGSLQKTTRKSFARKFAPLFCMRWYIIWAWTKMDWPSETWINLVNKGDL